MSFEPEFIEKINLIVNEFLESEHWKESGPIREEKHEKYVQWVNPQAIESMDDEEFVEKFKEYYSDSGGGRQWLPPFYKGKLAEDPRLKEVILYLLDENIDIEERFRDVVENGRPYHIQDFGRALATAILMTFNRDEYTLFNNKVEDGLGALKIELPFSSRDHVGTQYKKLLEKMTQIIEITEPKINFEILDGLLHWVFKVDEGKNTVSSILGDSVENNEKDDTTNDVNYWIEKTIVRGRNDRENGPLALGNALWSPQLDRGGSQYYEIMKEPKPGDVVYHFTDNTALTDASIVNEPYDDEFKVPLGTDWDYNNDGQTPGYMISLRDHLNLENPIHRDSIFKEKAEQALKIREKYSGLFYNRVLNLNQGSYLTRAPYELIELLNDISIEKTGEPLPYFEKIAIPQIYTTNKQSEHIPLLDEESYQKIHDLLENKRQIILYGPPGTGKTWVAKNYVNDYLSKNPPRIKKKVFEPIEISDISGFSDESFKFLQELAKNNRKVWFDENIDRFRAHIDHPLRAITGEVGRYVAELNSDFETTPDSHHTISRINRNTFGRQDIGTYYPYMWSAFFRKSVGDKRKDVQLFITIFQTGLRFGLGFGTHQEAKNLQQKFISNIKSNPSEFLDIIDTLGSGFDFHWAEDGKTNSMKIRNAIELEKWLVKDDLSITKTLTSSTLPKTGREQAVTIIETLRTLYPLYLFATTDNPWDIYDEYQAGYDNEEETVDLKQFWEFITFHQSYSYEEFIEGIRPQLTERTEGEPIYKIQPGIFKTLCEKARQDKQNTYFLIIDEINRGNISKIFGELITLLENDKRLGPENVEQENTIEAKLPYSKENFTVPWNLMIIGTMNTADKSIALVDVALRRRFGFIEMLPDIDKVEPIRINDQTIDLPQILTTINQKIEILFDRDHQIGHSYLMKLGETPSIIEVRNVFYNEIFPLIQEYFYGDWTKIRVILGDFVETIRTYDQAQEITREASRGIYKIKELHGDQFIQALNKLTSEEEYLE
ncbi:MAG: DUF2461 family protein [Candidatus Hodarchaeales archaeon]